MFAKLLKHEWRNCRQILRLLCAVTLASGGMVGLTAVYLTRTGGQKSYVLPILLMLLAIMAIGICAAVGTLYLFWRFYQSRFTDEGYLTFTLPVNGHQQLLAAIFNILRGGCLVFLSTLGAVLLVAVIYGAAFFPRDFHWGEFFQAAWHYLPEFLDAVYWSGCLEAFVLLLVWLVQNVIVLMLSITLGAVLARKHRFLTAAAVYYGIKLAQLWGLFSHGFGNESLGLWGYGMCVNLAVIAAGYALMHWLMDRKLNLI